MKQGTIDLFNSERGVFAILVLVAATMLVILGRIDPDTWVTLTKWLATVLIASKTVTSAIDAYHVGKATAAIAVQEDASEIAATPGSPANSAEVKPGS